MPVVNVPQAFDEDAPHADLRLVFGADHVPRPTDGGTTTRVTRRSQTSPTLPTHRSGS